MTTITARIDAPTQAKLEQLAKSTERSRSWLVSEAVKRYIEQEAWQIAAIEEGVRAADAGEFASDKEVKDFFASWGVHEQ